jgi:hypothetical protein
MTRREVCKIVLAWVTKIYYFVAYRFWVSPLFFGAWGVKGLDIFVKSVLLDFWHECCYISILSNSGKA